MVGHRDERIAATVKELGQFGLITGEKADLTIVSDTDERRSRIETKDADTDRLVKAAGVVLPMAFLEHSGADYDRSFRINRPLFGMWTVESWPAERCRTDRRLLMVGSPHALESLLPDCLRRILKCVAKTLCIETSQVLRHECQHQFRVMFREVP